MRLDILVLITQGVVMFTFLVIGARVTLRARSILKGGLATYGLLVLWAALFCFLLPLTVSWITKDTSFRCGGGPFPDVKGIIAMPMLGWIHGFAFAAIVRVIQIGIERVRGTKEGTTEQQDGAVTQESAQSAAS